MPILIYAKKKMFFPENKTKIVAHDSKADIIFLYLEVFLSWDESVCVTEDLVMGYFSPFFQSSKFSSSLCSL